MAKQRVTSDDPTTTVEVSDDNDVGIDLHKKTLTAAVSDRRGGTVATATFKVSRCRASGAGGVGDGLRAGAAVGHRGCQFAGPAHRGVLDRTRP